MDSELNAFVVSSEQPDGTNTTREALDQTNYDAQTPSGSSSAESDHINERPSSETASLDDKSGPSHSPEVYKVASANHATPNGVRNPYEGSPNPLNQSAMAAGTGLTLSPELSLAVQDPNTVFSPNTAPPLDTSGLDALDISLGMVDVPKKVHACFAKLEFSHGVLYVMTNRFELGRDIVEHENAKREYKKWHEQLFRGPRRPRRRQKSISEILSQGGGSVVNGASAAQSVADENVSAEALLSEQAQPQSSHSQPSHSQPDEHQVLFLQEGKDGKPDMLPIQPPRPEFLLTERDWSDFLATWTSISKRHIRIEYNDEEEDWELHVLGRNGVYMNNDFVGEGQVEPLASQDCVQIGAIEMRFCLPPGVPGGDVPAEDSEFEGFEEEEHQKVQAASDSEDDEDQEDQEEDEEDEENEENGIRQSVETPEIVAPPSRKKTKRAKTPPPPKPKSKKRKSPEPEEIPSVEELLIPKKRKGPGRPPKDGIMSKRERALLKKAEKLAAMKAANGGVTPPPSGKGKVGRPPRDSPEPETPADKPEKRKYTKRTKSDQGVETPQLVKGDSDEGRGRSDSKQEKPRARSETPPYPPESSFSEEDLKKPPHTYAVLIYDVFMEKNNKPMSLKEIYRALEWKFPYFVYGKDDKKEDGKKSIGWQSSVRHNMKSEGQFEQVEKDGKGFKWRLAPNAKVDREKKQRRASPPARPAPSSTGPPTMQPYQMAQQAMAYPQHPPLPHYAMPPHPQHHPLPANGPAAPYYHHPPMPHGPPPQPLPNAQYQSPYAVNQHPPSGTPPVPHRGFAASPSLQPPLHPHSPAPRPLPIDPNAHLPMSDYGLQRLDAFENALAGSEDNTAEDAQRIHRVFDSVKKRILFGAISSSLPDGEDEEERAYLAEARKMAVQFPRHPPPGIMPQPPYPMQQPHLHGPPPPLPPPQASPNLSMQQPTMPPGPAHASPTLPTQTQVVPAAPQPASPTPPTPAPTSPAAKE